MMYSYMRDQMMDMFDALQKVDITQTPSYKFMLALSNTLKADGVPPLVAERLVSRMQIKISESAGADPELMRRAVECYADLIMRMKEQITQDFTSSPYDVLEAMASHFSISMEF
jgi:hypothetical protein